MTQNHLVTCKCSSHQNKQQNQSKHHHDNSAGQASMEDKAYLEPGMFIA